MTAAIRLATHSVKPATQAAVDWSRWIEARHAARLLGDHPGTLNRNCPKLELRGDAMKCPGPDGGNAKWWINRGYDLRLAPGKAGEAYQMPDLSPYTERQVDLAMQRVACVKRLWMKRASETRPQKKWLSALIDQLRQEHPGIQISDRSLRRWHTAYRDPADLVKLIDSRGGNTRGEPDPACWDIFRQLYLSEKDRKIKTCWRRVKQKAKADGLTWCSYPQLLRLIRKRISPSERCKYRHPETYRSKHSDYQDMDPEAWAPGECWQGDHSVLDIWCSYEGKRIRPWLTAWMDWRTRKIVGWVMCDSPNSSTILAAFARAMRDDGNQGGPDIVYIDNGKDYAAEFWVGATKKQYKQQMKALFKKRQLFSGKDYDEPSFRGLYGVLGINVIFALPYSARSKGRIERWFGYSLHEEHDKDYATYTGRSPETRPSGLAKVLKDQLEVPTFEQVRYRLGQHIDRYNSSCDHNKQDLDGLSPDEAMALARRRVFADPGVLDRFMLSYSKPVRVRRHRVTVNVLGAKGLVFKSDDTVFADLNGREEYYRVGYDQDDVRTATLFDEQMRPVCGLYQADFGRHATTAVGRKHLGAVLSRQRKLNGAKKIQVEAGLDEILTTEDLALLEAEKQSPPEPLAPTPNELPTKLVQTPVDGHGNALQQIDYKQAAGAEVFGGDQPRRRLTDPSDLMADLDAPLLDDDQAGADEGPIDFGAYLDDGFDIEERRETTDVSDYTPDDQWGAL